MADTSFHSLAIEAVTKQLATDPERGLTEEEARTRLAKYGPNELPRERRASVILLFLKQFHSGLTYILFAAAALSFFAGERNDVYGILLAVLIRAVFAFVQERRAEAAIEKLRGMVVQEASVVRGGKVMRIPAVDIVPGDLVVLTEGDRVPADARVVEAKELNADESALTGESSAVAKTAEPAPAESLIPDRTGMVWMGTAVVSGQGTAVVTETGPRTEFGKIAVSLVDIKRGRTPLETHLDRLGRQLGILAVILSAIVLALGAARGFPLIEMFFFAVAMMVSVIPEGLPAVLAVVLAIGVQRMAKRNAIIRHVPSVETLGAATVICTDKTGTLTENKMTVREIGVSGHRVQVTGEGWDPRGEFVLHDKQFRPAELPEVDLLIRAVGVCNKADVEWHGRKAKVVGDPTEAALVVLAAKAGFRKEQLEKEYKKVDEVPFNSERKFRAVLAEHVDIRDRSAKFLFVVGAYGVVRDQSNEVMKDGKERSFDGEVRKALDTANQDMAERALRVLGVAYKKMPADTTSLKEGDVRDLTFIGAVGMIDPPRRDVAKAIVRCRRAGIRVIMATGDQRTTAVAIAREIGLTDDTFDEKKMVFTEKETATMDDTAFAEAMKEAVIFARVTPQTKFRMVSALQGQGHVVAMTGDGVNDAPALKKASIGIAMGIAGTDVTKEVADMVLTDDNFVSIVNAVEEGRIVYRNVKQTTAYLFMTNIGEAFTILVSLIIGMPLPLLPAQILWMNLITDGFPDIALATEPAHEGVLSEKPRKKGAAIMSRYVLALSAITAILMCAGTLALFAWALGVDGIDHARTVAFTTMAMFQLWNVFNMRSATASLLTLPPPNLYILGAVTLSITLQLVVLYLPALQKIFHTVPLSAGEWLMIAAVTSSVFFAVEAYKLLGRRGIVPKSWA